MWTTIWDDLDLYETCRVASLVLMFLGLAFVVVGHLIPTDYQSDPSLSARQMEAIEMRNDRLAIGVEVCVFAGVMFISVGGLLLVIVMVMVSVREGLWSGECHQREPNTTPTQIPRRGIRSSASVGGTYGSTETDR